MSSVAVVLLCDVEVPQADGFVNRNALLIRALRRHHDVTVIGLAPRAERILPDVDLPIVQPSGFDVHPRRFTHLVRLARLIAGRAGFDPLERRLRRVIRGIGPDMVILMTYRRVELVRVVRDLAPTVLFAEERAGGGEPRPGGGLRQRLWAAYDDLRRRAAGGIPLVCVVSPGEVEWARARFSDPVDVVPHSFDLAHWTESVSPDPASGVFDVLTIGNFLLERNAQGLASIIEHLEARGWPEDLRVRVVSASGYHEVLQGRQGEGVILEGRVEDPRPLYRSSQATLVPAFEAVGIKNGIIQGWATQCPVITTPASAATVGGADGVDVLVGEGPEEIAAILEGLRDAARLESLVARGRKHLEDEFSDEAHDQAVESLVRRIAP